ncbi:MAG: cellulose biosynthesis cyclic di-GMP-binding regulatory protein BcsB [Ewingella sp.]
MNRPRNLMITRRLSAVPGASLLRKITTGLLLTFSSLPFTHAEETPAPDIDQATSFPAAPSWLPPTPPMPSTPAPTQTPSSEYMPQADTTPANNSDSVNTSPLTNPAVQVADPVTVPAPVIPLVQPVTTSMTVAEMGQPNGLTLSGGQLQSGIIFTLPADEVVTSAHLSLALKISPALIARDTTLELMLNGQPLGSLPLNQTGNGGDVYQLDIPSAMVVSSNNLSFRVHDSNTMTCEKDQSDKYWVTILPATNIALEGQKLNIGRNLGNFPRPFFDSLQMQESKITMVFSAAMKPGDVSAAAIVSSYLGMLSDYRAIDFPVILNDLPDQNGILFGKPGDKIGSLTLPASNGASIQIIDNPINPVYKLLLVLGNDDNQLRQAAYRLISSGMPNNTDHLDVAQLNIPSSKPYDAPRWIDTSRPVTLGELAGKDPDSLISNGIYHDSIQVAFRAAPDLFMWDGHNIPVRIDYRFPTENWIDEDNSRLNISLNSNFLRSLTVNKVGLLENIWRRLGGDSRQERYTIQLAPYLIYGDNQLQFYFDIKPKKDAPCSILTSNNIKSRIDPKSFIDLSGSYHFAQLPNLSYFVGASYPYSKLADFSDTLMLLPPEPTSVEIHTLLNLAARAGKATGVPVTHVQITFGLKGDEQGNPLFDRDILAVTTLGDSSFNQQLLANSPFSLNANSMGVKTPTEVERIVAWLTGDWYRQPVDADRYLSSTAAWRGFVSYRSRWSSDHVVVVAIGTDDQQLLKIHSDLKLPQINANVRGDLAIITDENGIRSFSVGPQFPTGQMPWYMMVLWYASTHIVILSLIATLVSLMIGLSLFVILRRHAAKRLGQK